jgi:type VI secretion system secreted protein Hcp
MAFDGFILIDGIEGESSDAAHPGWIEILDYDLGLSQKASGTASSAGGAGAERAGFAVFSFSKLLDQATPGLALACAAGTHIDTISVELCRAGTDKQRFMQYTFRNCLLSKFNSSSDSGFPRDDVAFVYGHVQWAYTRQNRAGGQACGNAAAGWNLQRNCKA